MGCNFRKFWQYNTLTFAVALLAAPADAAKLTLLDGRILEGRLGMVAGVAEDPDSPTNQPGGVNVQPILVVDDGLRRTYVSKRLVREINEAALSPEEKIHVPQRVAEAGLRIGGVGPILRITPFDEFGRRIFSMQTSDGELNVVQGITEVTPVFTKVEGLLGRRAYVWEMRVGTDSIPRETLSKVLQGAIDPENPNQRLKIVRLYLESGRHTDARKELEGVLADFPDLKNLETELRALRQMGARRVLDEIERRAESGQHRLVLKLLANFPAEGVAGETLQKVREIQAGYTKQREEGVRALELFDRNLAIVEDEKLKYRLEKIRPEIVEQLNLTTLDRMTAFLRLADDEKLTPGQKLAIAVSGWLVGSDSAGENLPVALSMYEVRGLVEQYLRETLKVRRVQLLEELRAQEGAAVGLVAKLLTHMKPPLVTEAADEAMPGLYELRVPGLDPEPEVTYYVQLPPEYDPYRSYPAVVTLNGTGTTAQQQIDWWAGDAAENGARNGQAGRHGYIVIAVDWLKPRQSSYQYSAREHDAVLSSLRDACRRFSIDTDRVFLSGHSIGGNAAWDMGLAHPDLWAGVIPIVAVADRYCAHYWENAEYVPFYIVAGELDGDKMSRNSRELDRYLRRGFDTTLVEFLGRGHEHFYDEVQRLFDWMNRQERNFYPKEFTCTAMRPWDNYFWWIEMNGFPERSTVDPASWPPPRGTRAATISGKINNTSIYVKSASDRVTLWLSPELIDFGQRNTISVGGRRVSGRDDFLKPDLEVLLEDARARADRQHPFWARVDVP